MINRWKIERGSKKGDSFKLHEEKKGWNKAIKISP